MGNGKNLNPIFSLPINHRKRKARKIQFSGAVYAARPAMGCFKNPIDHLVELIHKSFCCPRTAFPVPARGSLGLFNSGRMQR